MEKKNLAENTKTVDKKKCLLSRIEDMRNTMNGMVGKLRQENRNLADFITSSIKELLLQTEDKEIVLGERIPCVLYTAKHNDIASVISVSLDNENNIILLAKSRNMIGGTHEYDLTDFGLEERRIVLMDIMNEFTNVNN